SDAGFHRALHYWLRSFGQFHTLTASLLGQQGIVLPDMHLRTTTEEKERHDQGKRKNPLSLDFNLFEDSTAYLTALPRHTAIHRDAKPDNLFGKYLLDHEYVCMGPAVMDLALLFIHYNVPKRLWNESLEYYVQHKTGTIDKEEVRNLNHEIFYAITYMTYKQTISSCLRQLQPPNMRELAHYTKYFLGNCL
ncbi:MAG: phosphotransferase, partial [Candidatus Woesearchaeota archaeon]